MEMSSTIAELAKALAKAQAAMKPVKAECENPYFHSKYADLAAIWESCRKPLTENGLSVVQTIEQGDSRVIVRTILLHESGEWISSRLALTPAKNDPQTVGSAITYARRYSLAAMVGACAFDEDDDAQQASNNAATNRAKPATADKPQDVSKSRDVSAHKRAEQGSQNDGMATDAQRRKIYAQMRELEWTPDELKKFIKEQYGKEDTKTMTRKEASELIEHLQTILDIRNADLDVEGVEEIGAEAP